MTTDDEPHAQADAEKRRAEHLCEVEAWRAQRLAKLRSDEGWLVLSGLFWLEEGNNDFGSAAGNVVELPAHSAPPHAGHFELQRGTVTVVVAPGTQLFLRDQPVTRQVLRSDDPGPADVCALGDLRFFVLARDGRLAIRLRDLNSPLRAKFKGIPHFPVRPEFRVSAAFVPHAATDPHAADSARGAGAGAGADRSIIKITNQAGKISEMVSPGRVVFTLGGKTLALDAVLDDANSKRLTLLFRDGTSGHESYGAGRFLYSEGLPSNGFVTLDFNKAYNPPCALNPLVVCPLPPPQNRIDVRVEAGEMTPDEAH